MEIQSTLTSTHKIRSGAVVKMTIVFNDMGLKMK